MSKLTPKQEKYVQGLVSGLSQREAYKNAYNAKNMKDTTIDARASKLLAEYKVSIRYNELMEEHKAKALFTREEASDASMWLLNQAKYSIEVIDEGYVRQGTANAYLGALEKLIDLNLVDPLTKAKYDKIVKEFEDETEESQFNQLKEIRLQMKGMVKDD